MLDEPSGLARELAHVRAVIPEPGASVREGFALQIFPRAEQTKTKKARGVKGDVLAASDLQVRQADAAQGVPVPVAGDAGLQLQPILCQVHRVDLTLRRLSEVSAWRGLYSLRRPTVSGQEQRARHRASSRAGLCLPT